MIYELGTLTSLSMYLFCFSGNLIFSRGSFFSCKFVLATNLRMKTIAQERTHLTPPPQIHTHSYTHMHTCIEMLTLSLFCLSVLGTLANSPAHFRVGNFIKFIRAKHHSMTSGCKAV